jgi:hypothetical protein
LDTPQHRNRGKNLFAYAAGSKYAKEVKALFTEDIEEENDDEKEEEKKGGQMEEKDTDNRKPAAQMTGRKGQKNVNDINGNRDEDDAMEETDDDNPDKAANGEESVFENEEDMKEETDTDDDDVDDEKQDDEEETENDEEGVSTGDEVTIVKVVKPRKKGKKSQVTEVDKAESMIKHQARKATVEEEKAVALASFKNLKPWGTNDPRKPAPTKDSVGPWKNSMSLEDWDDSRLNGPPPDANLPPMGSTCAKSK